MKARAEVTASTLAEAKTKLDEVFVNFFQEHVSYVIVSAQHVYLPLLHGGAGGWAWQVEGEAEVISAGEHTSYRKLS